MDYDADWPRLPSKPEHPLNSKHESPSISPLLRGQHHVHSGHHEDDGSIEDDGPHEDENERKRASMSSQETDQLSTASPIGQVSGSQSDSPPSSMSPDAKSSSSDFQAEPAQVTEQRPSQTPLENSQPELPVSGQGPASVRAAAVAEYIPRETYHYFQFQDTWVSSRLIKRVEGWPGHKAGEYMWKIVPYQDDPYLVKLPGVKHIILEKARPFCPKEWNHQSKQIMEANENMIIREAQELDSTPRLHVCILENDAWFYLEHRACWAPEKYDYNIPTGPISWETHEELAGPYKFWNLGNQWGNGVAPYFHMPVDVATPNLNHAKEHHKEWERLGWAPFWRHGGWMGVDGRQPNGHIDPTHTDLPPPVRPLQLGAQEFKLRDRPVPIIVESQHARCCYYGTDHSPS